MRHVLLLRGINLGPARRIPMAALREQLDEAGYANVATHLQSGNVVLEAGEPSAPVLAAAVSELVSARAGFAVPVSARSRAELEAVIAQDPIPGAAQAPKLYQVTFLAEPPDDATVARLHELAGDSERVVLHGRELYSFHPEGIARSRLAANLSAPALGPTATTRNWRTVLALRDLAAG